MLELALALVTSIVMKFAPVCFSTEYDFSPPSPYKCLHNIWTVPWIAWISDVSTILGDSSTTGTYPEYGKINLKISRFDNKTYSETALHLSLANQNFMLWSPISYSLQIVWQLINVCLFHLLVQKVFFLSSKFFEHVQYFLNTVKFFDHGQKQDFTL